MAYVKKTLAPGEEYIYRAHFNWTYDVESWFWPALAAFPAGMWIYASARNYFAHDPFGHAFLFFAGSAFMLGVFICFRRYIHKWTTVLAVTSARLILKTGLIARQSHEMMLDETFPGRVFGYGVLQVRGTGEALIEFPVIGAPMRVRREIETALLRARGLTRGSA